MVLGDLSSFPTKRFHFMTETVLTRSTKAEIYTKGPTLLTLVNTLRPRQNGRHFPDDIFKCIFLNQNVWIPIEISLTFVPKGSINNNPALFQIMAWRRPGDKPLSEPMMVSSLTHICVTRPQWVNFDLSMDKQPYTQLSEGNYLSITKLPRQCRRSFGMDE